MKNTIQNLITLIVGILALLILTVGAYYLGVAWVHWLDLDLDTQQVPRLHWVTICWLSGILVLGLAAFALVLSYFIGEFLIEGLD